jgi:hypothetical protein
MSSLAPADRSDRSAIPSDVSAGIDQLRRSPPLAPLAAGEWWRLLNLVEDFAACWDAVARDGGWADLDLFSLHPRAPWARLNCMGAAWFIARGGYQVLRVDAAAFTLATRTGARLQFHRVPLPPEAVLPWDRGRR